MGDELLYESQRTRVTRVRLDGGATTAIRKELLGASARQRAERELAALARLAEVSDIPHVVAGSTRPEVVLLEDLGAECLADLIRARRLDTTEVLELATGLAAVLAEIHQRGVIHLDVNPANILLRGSPVRPVLIDFDLAGTVTAGSTTFGETTELFGTLAYIAPEQTGRTNWPVDQRSDLYALGATLYELATGAPPFSGDPLQVTHDNLTQVPAWPDEVDPAVPAGLAQVIMHLLEKEPDRRYQSATGVLHDLRRVRDDLASGLNRRLPLGELDFPTLLVPSDQLVGRSAEFQALSAALAEVAAGEGRTVVISGPPGVGKTSIVNALRPLCTAEGGWFLSGKFDQYGTYSASGAIRQATQTLAYILLSEPETELTALRSQLKQVLGGNAGLLAALEPLFQPVLGVAPEAEIEDPANLAARIQQIGLALLNTVACAGRPVVMFLDDLQWADASSVNFVNAILTSPELRWVLLICAYRDTEVHSTHPLRPMLRRWRQLPRQPIQINLNNLGLTDLSTLLADLLRLSAAEVTTLATFVESRTAGNPFSTIELVNALRSEHTLVLGSHGWTWDPGALRLRIESSDMVAHLATRIATLPDPSRDLVEALSFLGGSVEVALLRNATARTDLDRWLTPALVEGLLVMEHTPRRSVRFRHDWIQQAACHKLSAQAQRERRMALARRLAKVPEHGLEAAEQYLPVVDDLDDPAERRLVVGLLRAAADRLRIQASYSLVNRYLSAAVALVATEADTEENRRLTVRLIMERHAALYALGEVDEVDRLYRQLRQLTTDILLRSEFAWVQINSLTNRGDPQGALNLGVATLAELGHPVPAETDLAAQTDQGLDALRTWIATSDAAADLQRSATEDPQLRAIGNTISHLIPPAYFCQSALFAWLMVEAFRLWASGGPDRALLVPLGSAGLVTIALREDYDTGYAVVRRALAVGEHHGYEPGTSQVRYLYSTSLAPWFDALEESVRQARQARDGLVRSGDIQFAGFTYYSSATQILDCAPTLGEALAEVEDGLSFAGRTGNGFVAASLLAYRQAIRALSGQTEAPGSPNDPCFQEADHLATLTDNPNAVAFYHITRGLVATIFNDEAEVQRAIQETIPLLPLIQAIHCRVLWQVVRGLRIAALLRSDDRSGAGELAECRAWLARRAGANPAGFQHLLELVDAETAWAAGDAIGALRAFDRAGRAVSPQVRPWHQALIAERTARFQLAQGLDQAGQTTMDTARRRYQDWGATGKVSQLEREFPFLREAREPRPGAESHRDTSMSSETVDTLALLRASQALSSETNLDRLRERVTEILRALTGATAVQVLIRDPDTAEWILAGPGGIGEMLPASTASRHLLPLSAFRLVERTQEPLLVDDAVHDDRFSHDPYLRDVDVCSLMVVPILIRSQLRAMLILENRRSRAAFGAKRLDAVLLIAGQFTVSLNNALLYADLERKVAARTESLKNANEQLEVLAITDPLTGLANRRRLMDILDSEWRNSVRTQHPIGVAMLDIDHFKLYNDHYGHPAGDRCLQKVAEAVDRSIRDTDLLARYGGEEFAIVLPGTNASATHAIAERIRSAIAALNEPHLLTDSGIVTISIGVATMTPSQDNSVESLIEAADTALYLAKASGRNRVSDASQPV